MFKVKERGGTQDLPGGLNSNAPKQTCFHVLQNQGEEENSPYVVIFDMLPHELLKHFFVSTHVGDYVVAKRVYRRCLVSLSHRVTLVDL